MDGVHIKQEPHLLGSQLISENGLLGASVGGAGSLAHLIKHEMLEHGGGHHLQHPMEDSGDEMDMHHDDYKEDEPQRANAPSLDMSDVEDDDEDEDVAQDLSMAPESDAQANEHSNQG